MSRAYFGMFGGIPANSGLGSLSSVLGNLTLGANTWGAGMRPSPFCKQATPIL